VLHDAKGSRPVVRMVQDGAVSRDGKVIKMRHRHGLHFTRTRRRRRSRARTQALKDAESSAPLTRELIKRCTRAAKARLTGTFVATANDGDPLYVLAQQGREFSVEHTSCRMKLFRTTALSSLA